jgi:hypothetical protein
MTSSAYYSELKCSRHAERRVRQRGVRYSALEILLDHGDQGVHAGDGCESISISRDTARKLVEEGYPSDDVSRARKLVAILGRKGVVSVLRPQPGLRGRAYRRQFPTRRAKFGI